LLLLALVTSALGSTTVSAANAAPPRKYLLALGDSLAAGYQQVDRTSLPPIDPTSGFRDIGYPNSYAADVSLTQRLSLIDLACPGETSTSMLSTPALGQCATSYRAEFGASSQMAAAIAFLSSHPNQVSLVTLDIGANDLDMCISATRINASCLKNTNAAVVHNLSTILSSLTAAMRKSDPRARLIGMNYYDPFLGLSFTPGGTRDTELALVSVAATDAFNVELTAGFQKFGAARADVAAAFRTDSALPIARYGGRRLPIDVVEVCSWTWMCPLTSASQQDVHPNVAGYRVIASAFDRILAS
jgi:lysophospholipase L1-like esterase